MSGILNGPLSGLVLALVTILTLLAIVSICARRIRTILWLLWKNPAVLAFETIDEQIERCTIVRIPFRQAVKRDPLCTTAADQLTLHSIMRFPVAFEGERSSAAENVECTVTIVANFEEGDKLDTSILPSLISDIPRGVHPITYRLTDILRQEVVENGVCVCLAHAFAATQRQPRFRGTKSPGISRVLRDARHAMMMRGFRIEKMRIELSSPTIEKITARKIFSVGDEIAS